MPAQLTITETDADACCVPTLAAPLAPADAETLAGAFAALADPVRLRLLSLIAAAGKCCSCDLQEPPRQVAADRQPPHQGPRRRRPHRRREAWQVDLVARRARTPGRPPPRPRHPGAHPCADAGVLCGKRQASLV